MTNDTKKILDHTPNCTLIKSAVSQEQHILNAEVSYWTGEENLGLILTLILTANPHQCHDI